MKSDYLQVKLILPVIVISQFFCASLWFACNVVLEDLVHTLGIDSHAVGHFLSAVQFGFIIGTLTFAFLMIADRFSPSKVFFVSAVLGSISNLVVIWDGNNISSILIMRFLTGFFLAGIYPVGMKIAADHFEQGLGKSLGYLVGALVLGTAFPHLINDSSFDLSWKMVFIGTSIMALLGGFMMLLLVPDGPFRKAGQKLKVNAVFTIFKNDAFRSAAFGYFGHMWELYTFWAFVPIMIMTYNQLHAAVTFNIPLASFFIIAIGGMACVIGGYLAKFIGVKRVATTSLALSCICCLFSPLVFTIDSKLFFIGFLLFWGMVVVADSPMFSTLVAQNAPVELKGTSLTMVNSIGFAITIVSIQLINGLWATIESNNIYIILALGPIIGLVSLMSKRS